MCINQKALSTASISNHLIKRRERVMMMKVRNRLIISKKKKKRKNERRSLMKWKPIMKCLLRVYLNQSASPQVKLRIFTAETFWISMQEDISRRCVNASTTKATSAPTNTASPAKLHLPPIRPQYPHVRTPKLPSMRSQLPLICSNSIIRIRRRIGFRRIMSPQISRRTITCHWKIWCRRVID